ncbi:YIP1 family protein [Natrinema halophilum]|uniref:YIP1 family protein n=1 Tax=Natrinema halophilum TaxID=1699371 RepID=A0A7D5GMD3_9EURY|nr:YIP1 family protein [Natrinema halophilum]QLG50032.1 YIP1 family protein [Natrinema halophilum]
MDGHVWRLLVDPSTFFESDSLTLSQSVGFLVAIGVLCLGVLPPTISLLESPVIPDEVVFGAFPPIRYVTFGWEASIPGIVGILGGALIAEPLVAWVAFSVLFYTLSWPVANERGFCRTARCVAWGFVPQFVANVLALVVLFATFPSTPTEIWGIGVTIPARIYVSPPTVGPLAAAVSAVGIVCTLWSGYLWAHAVAAARGLTLRQGATVVAVPTVLVLGPI